MSIGYEKLLLGISFGDEFVRTVPLHAPAVITDTVVKCVVEVGLSKVPAAVLTGWLVWGKDRRWLLDDRDPSS